MKDKITLEQTEELYKFLQGEVPEGIHIKHPTKLSERKAFTIIWFLQEHLRLIPDDYERCCSCGSLYDTGCGGGIKRNRCYCEGCY